METTLDWKVLNNRFDCRFKYLSKVARVKPIKLVEEEADGNQCYKAQLFVYIVNQFGYRKVVTGTELMFLPDCEFRQRFPRK